MDIDVIDPGAVVTGRPPPPPRPDWDAYFMDFAKLARTRASCVRRQVGAVVVKNHMVLTTGYNGAPRGLPHAAEVGCLRDKLGVPSGQRHELCRGLHAEQNAIIQAARHGICIEGAVMYCTTHPCVICIKMIINAGLTRVYYLEGYADDIAEEIIVQAGFPVIRMPAGGVAESVAEGTEHKSHPSLPVLPS